MIVSESDVLLAALDRRLQVDSLAAIAPVASSSDGARGAAPQAAAGASSAAEPFPLGQVIDARVVDIAESGHVVADLAGQRLALSWPTGSGPAIGSRIALRVLARTPMLLFEDASRDGERRESPDAPTSLSVAARALQNPAATGAGALRFTAPILQIEVDGDPPLHAMDSATGSTNSATPDRISLDTVIVAQAPLTDRAVDPSVMLPFVLRGPAWPGQDVELVVRRDREDEAFENPVLDQWCGELMIDLPNLGRVSGHLAWSMQGLRIRLEGQDASSVASMSASTAELARALADVDLPVLAVSVGQPVGRLP
jgi:hypothetical protein